MNTQKQKKTDKDVVFLFGPTAVGKTDLLCSFFCPGYEVINADSVQVYRKLDIGSAKADPDTQKKIPHHLIDILDPDENFNVADFVSLADKACSEITQRGNTPIISGGTAYYFKSFMYGLSQAPQCNPEIREQVQAWVGEIGLKEAWNYLKSVDPVAADRINVNDVYRITRAVEVYRQTGRPLSSFEVPNKVRDSLNITAIGLYRDKDELRQRIAKRVDIMFEQGLGREIEGLIALGASSSWQSMQAIGYKEFIQAYEELGNFNSINLDKVKNEIVMNSIHYAKRQMTFFKSLEGVQWVRPEEVCQLSFCQKQR